MRLGTQPKYQLSYCSLVEELQQWASVRAWRLHNLLVGFYVVFIPFNEKDVEEPLYIQMCPNGYQPRPGSHSAAYSALKIPPQLDVCHPFIEESPSKVR